MLTGATPKPEIIDGTQKVRCWFCGSKKGRGVWMCVDKKGPEDISGIRFVHACRTCCPSIYNQPKDWKPNPEVLRKARERFGFHRIKAGKKSRPFSDRGL